MSKIDPEKLTVHPAADVFPMLEPEELEALADDIKQNRLIHPIILDADAQVIDGRNRLAACKIAGIEPRFERLNGADPIAYILSTNIARRHLNAGQRAVAVAKIYPGGSGKGANPIELGFSGERLRQARSLVRYAPELADQVLAGKLALNDAYNEARVRKAAAVSYDEKVERLKKEAPDLADLQGITIEQAFGKLRQRSVEALQLKKLAEAAPDLAGLVEEGRMPLTEANATAAARKEALEHARDSSTRYLHNIVHAIDPEGWKHKERAEFLAQDVCERLWLQLFDQDLTSKLLSDCASVLALCAAIFEEREKGPAS